MLPSVEQLWQMRLAGQQGQAAQQPAQGATTPQGSYYGMNPQIMMGGAPYPSGAATGGGGGGGGGTVATAGGGGGGGTATMATNVASQIPFNVSLPEWQRWYGQNVGKTIMVGGQPKVIGQDIDPNATLAAYRNQSIRWDVPQTQMQATPGATTSTDTRQPEQRALEQLAKIDPTSEALRQQVGQSYLADLLTGGPTPQFNLDLSRGAAAPSQADVQSYLDLYKRIDPEGYAQRAALAGQMGSYLSSAQREAALGAQLDPSTIREIEQQTRQGQIARGNVYGTPQLVQEAMQRGQMGEARKVQRQQALGSALGAQQGYLTSGAGLGDIANQLYGQGYSRYLQGYGAQLQARQARQQGALSYLGSGQTPYQAGAAYLGSTEQRAAAAGQNQYQYNPASLGANYLSNQQQQYGLDIGSQAQNYFNSLQNAYGGYGGGAGRNRTGAALGGAASGALSGATAGAALGGPYAPVTAAIGGVLGGALGGAGGYFS